MNREQYTEYLAGPTWQGKRRAVLRRSRGVCEECLRAKAVEVHHLTYERVGREDLRDLVALCGVCHDRAHGWLGADVPDGCEPTFYEQNEREDARTKARAEWRRQQAAKRRQAGDDWRRRIRSAF